MSDRLEQQQSFTRNTVGDKSFVSVSGPWLETIAVTYGFLEAMGYKLAQEAIVGKEITITAANGEARYRVDHFDEHYQIADMSLIKGETWEIDEEGNRA